MTIKHSDELGGLVPLPGWYALDADGEAVGPFETEAEAREHV